MVNVPHPFSIPCAQKTPAHLTDCLHPSPDHSNTDEGHSIKINQLRQRHKGTTSHPLWLPMSIPQILQQQKEGVGLVGLPICPNPSPGQRSAKLQLPF